MKAQVGLAKISTLKISNSSLALNSESCYNVRAVSPNEKYLQKILQNCNFWHVTLKFWNFWSFSDS